MSSFIDGADRLTIDVGSLSSAEGFVLQGDTLDDNAGTSVAGAGDLNGDGFPDVLVGSPYGNDGRSNAGEAYVIFGTANGFGSIVNGRQVVAL